MYVPGWTGALSGHGCPAVTKRVRSKYSVQCSLGPSILSLLGNVLSLAVDGCNSDSSPGSIKLMVLEFINKT